MLMTPEQKEKARRYRQQIYREQKALLDKQKREKKETQRKERDKSLWALIKTADDLGESSS